MERTDVKYIVDVFESFAIREKISLWIVGSLGYRDALDNLQNLKLCDDIDCVFIYEKIDSLKRFPYLDKNFLSQSEKLLQQNDIDMFSNKFLINGIQISADYISVQYLRGLIGEKFDYKNKYRRKYTDAVEKAHNVYCDILGNSILYKKEIIHKDIGRVYVLPIHLYNNNLFCPGVLLNKFLYHPLCIADGSESRELIQQLYNNVDLICRKYGNGASVYNTFYKKDVLQKCNIKI